MNILKFIRDDIEIKIIANLDLPISYKSVSSKKEILEEVKNFDLGFFVDKNLIEVITKNGYILSFEEFILTFMYLINASSREQIGVVIPKSIPKILDNELTYLILKRKDNFEYSDIYFLTTKDKKIIFPYFDKNENIQFNIIKFSELLKRNELDLDKFIYEKLDIKNS